MEQVPTTDVVDPLAGIDTPDPLFTTEQLAGYAVAIATNALILFAADMSDDKKAAILGLVNTLVVVFSLVHASTVRKGRAMARGYANSRR